VLLSLTFALAFFGLKSTNDNISQLRNLSLRNLAFNKTKLNEICKEANITGYAKMVLDTINSTVVENSESVQNFVYNADLNDGSEKLISYVKTQNQQDLTDYVIGRLTPLIVFIVFAVISLITWIVYFFCCCCPCCCCSSKGCCCQGDTCPNISFFISMICFILTIACCIAGFVFSTQFSKDTNAVTCQFFTFYDNTKSGQNITTTPRWIGISGIKKTLQDTNAALDKIAQNANTAFNNASWTETEPKNFQNNLTDVYSRFKDQSLTNTNPAASLKKVTTIVPLYISNLGDYKKSGTLLNSINAEFDLKISGSITLIDEAKSYSKEISKYSQPIKDSLNSVINSISPLETSFDKIETDVITPWGDIQVIIKDQAINGFLALFGAISAFSLLCVLFMVFYAYCCKIQCFRFCLHLFWIILGLFVFILFLVGVVFGVVSVIGKDGVQVFNFIFSSQNLNSDSPKVITDRTAGKYMDVCLNKNGDLAKDAFGDSLSGNTQNLEKLYNVSNTLIQTRKQIEDNKNSIAIQTINTNFASLKVNFAATTDNSLGSDSLVSQFSQLNLWSDYNSNPSYQKGCSSNTKDFWTTDLTYCKSGYVKANAGTESSGDPNCLVYKDWSSNQVTTRYSTRPASCGNSGSSDFSSVKGAINSYYSAFKTYSESNTVLIGQLETETNKLNDSFVSMSGNLLTMLQNIDGIITPLVEIFQQFVGDAGLFQLINCSFMGTDIKGLLRILGGSFSESASSTYGSMIACSFFLYVGILCMFIVILRKKIQPEENGDFQKDVEMARQN
jgi:hypothetical protein